MKTWLVRVLTDIIETLEPHETTSERHEREGNGDSAGAGW